jgi:hypothetical protein
MSAWNRAKVEDFRAAFMEFLGYVVVDSKEIGRFILGDHIYRAQQMFLDTVCDALSDDIHDIYILKSRQLGLSTISRALGAFWLGMHDGLRGAVVFDTGSNANEARSEIGSIIARLPAKFKFPREVGNNRTRLRLENGSQSLFMSAGRSNARSGGGLGRSVGINFSHASEISSWVNEEGLASYKRSLAENFSDRLYIWESTARGFNSWHAIWQEAKLDDLSKRCAFFGWWAKDNHEIARDTPEFERYGSAPPNETELDRIKAVKLQYGWQITPEQLAWYRKMSDPASQLEEGDSEDSLIIQEEPWTEEEAFQQTGSTFFLPEVLTKAANRIQMLNARPQQFKFVAGNDFVSCDIISAKTRRAAELRVWEEPAVDGSYVVCADPAFGRDEKNNYSALSVLRCYADGLDQVAEYASPLCPPHHFAWFALSLVGWYGGTKPGARVLMVCELNGPGEEFWRQYQSSMLLVQRGYLRRAAAEKGIADLYTNARSYIYQRSDTVGQGHNWQMKTTIQNKVQMMEACRNYLQNGVLVVNSMEALEEMRTISRDGDTIEAEGKNRDDRTFAIALGVRGWDDRLRRALISGNRTRQAERARLSVSITDQRQLYDTYHLQTFFRQKERARAGVQRQLQVAGWRRAPRPPRPVARRQ